VNGIDGATDNTIDANVVETMTKDDPHLFSSLINLPTFAKNGEKVSFLIIYLKKKTFALNP
jgi:hypothetical protein